jgi:hypothetical protein
MRETGKTDETVCTEHVVSEFKLVIRSLNYPSHSVLLRKIQELYEVVNLELVDSTAYVR